MKWERRMPFASLTYAPLLFLAPRSLLISIAGGTTQVDVSALHWLLRIWSLFVALTGQIGHLELLPGGSIAFLLVERLGGLIVPGHACALYSDSLLKLH